eukprot:529071_1
MTAASTYEYDVKYGCINVDDIYCNSSDDDVDDIYCNPSYDEYDHERITATRHRFYCIYCFCTIFWLTLTTLTVLLIFYLTISTHTQAAPALLHPTIVGNRIYSPLYGQPHGISVNATDQGNVNGITWIIDDDTSSIAQFSFSSEDQSIFTMFGSNYANNESCFPFELHEDDYIIAFQVTYGNHIYGLEFRTQDQYIHRCVSSTLPVDSTKTSVNYIFGYFLSGFIIYSNDTLNGISFEFTNIEQLPYNTSTKSSINYHHSTTPSTSISNHDNRKVFGLNYEQYETAVIALMILCMLMILITIILPCVYLYKKQQSDVLISNVLVTVIGIGDYQNDIYSPELNDEQFITLPVELDVRNLQNFSEQMKYQFMTRVNNGIIKTNWNATEIIQYLQNDVCNELFDENDQIKYDGLIVCISSHGKEHSIVSSDLTLINKDVIHRIISLTKPRLRNIPRIFLFDACEGNEECMGDASDMIQQSKTIELKDISLTKIKWKNGMKNPDFKLAEVHSSNVGFKSFMGSKTGSLMIHKFVEKMILNTSKNKNKKLATIFDEIQNELHNENKQQIKATFNNNTGHLKLKQRNISNRKCPCAWL